jgi:hypothetical protein
VVILLIVIGGYFVIAYWCLLYQWLLVDILLLHIGGYSINGYWWLLIVICGYYIGCY